MNSAASLAAGLPVGRHSARCLVLAAYAVPAALAWTLLGAVLAALPLTGLALLGAAGYGCYYGVTEIAGRRGLLPPGRRWQVPQTMMIDASPRRRVLVWGAVLGPGFATRNPYAGFGLLPIVVAAMHGAGYAAALVLAAAVGLAHGVARATVLLRDVAELRQVPAVPSAPVAVAQLDLLLKTVYWRRCDGVLLLVTAGLSAFLAGCYF